MATFDSVYKGTKGFFKKTFSYANKVEVKTSGDDGVAFTGCGGVKADKSGFADLEGSYKSGPVRLDKLAFSSSGKFNADISLPDVAADTKVTFKCEDGTRTSDASVSAKFGVVTTQDFGVATGITVDVDAVKATVDASVLFNYDGVVFGASGSLDTNLNAKDKKSPEVSKADALIGYKTGDATYGFQTSGKFTKGTAFVHSKMASGFTVTGDATFGLDGKALKDVDVRLGGKYAWDSSTTLFGAVNKKAEVQFAYQQAISSSTSLTVYSQVNALSLASDTHSFGTKLSLRA